MRSSPTNVRQGVAVVRPGVNAQPTLAACVLLEGAGEWVACRGVRAAIRVGCRRGGGSRVGRTVALPEECCTDAARKAVGAEGVPQSPFNSGVASRRIGGGGGDRTLPLRYCFGYDRGQIRLNPGQTRSHPGQLDGSSRIAAELTGKARSDPDRQGHIPDTTSPSPRPLGIAALGPRSPGRAGWLASLVATVLGAGE